MPHLVDGVRNETKIFVGLLALLSIETFPKQRGETGYLPQRGTQIMAHGVAEGFKLGVGRRKFLDALGELLVQLSYARLRLPVLLDLQFERAVLAEQVGKNRHLGAQYRGLQRLRQEIHCASLVTGNGVLLAVRRQKQNRDVL